MTAHDPKRPIGSDPKRLFKLDLLHQIGRLLHFLGDTAPVIVNRPWLKSWQSGQNSKRRNIRHPEKGLIMRVIPGSIRNARVCVEPAGPAFHRGGKGGGHCEGVRWECGQGSSLIDCQA